MQLSDVMRKSAPLGLVLTAAVCLCAQDKPPQSKELSKELRSPEAQGLAPRLTPGDYPSQVKVGDVTIAAEFARHSVPTAQGALSSEDFISVEVGLYGPKDARLQISLEDFSLRVDGKKNLLQAQPYGLVLTSIKDPEWSPPETASPKSKTSIGGSGGGPDPGSPPPVVHVPIEVQHAMAQRTQKASLPLGDRPLPVAGLLFFKYHGKPEKMSSLELLYNGPAGKAVIPLRP